ncbi:DUF3575 domain-containing protein [Coprobacter tertius]|uniref:DUF3575 domain-containing protein n=1 Tax=Coprobacter tertius TaxID=2944915 RepID=A0ABT1MHU0_9BACT|nr:DUF3575 domain-containing protein [Coprobacter tertius]MCP9612190.1 DUF3575 domain-containing protein [Coprobacter tertius]
MKKIFLIVFLSGLACYTSWGQKVAVKSNLLYAVSTTLNLGVEFGLSSKWSFDLSGNYNPWKFGKYRLKHGLIQPEIRYWLCEKFNGHFWGLHGIYATYNVGGLFFNDNMKHNRYQGHLFGCGIVYGYHWVLNDHWNLETSLGIGYARLSDKKYPIATCGEIIKKQNHNYYGPTKLAVSIIYIIK